MNTRCKSRLILKETLPIMFNVVVEIWSRELTPCLCHLEKLVPVSAEPGLIPVGAAMYVDNSFPSSKGFCRRETSRKNLNSEFCPIVMSN